MPKKVKSTKAAAKVITAETKSKKGTDAYRDEIDTKMFDLIDTVSENVQELFKAIEVVKQRLDSLDQKVAKIANRIGIV